MNIVLVLLTVNATHLNQLLGIVMFKTFKETLKKENNKHIIETSSTPLTKREYIALSSKAWEEGVTGSLDNIESDFRSSGIVVTLFNINDE